MLTKSEVPGIRSQRVFARNASQSLYPSLWNRLEGCWDFRLNCHGGNGLKNFGKSVAVSSLLGTAGTEKMRKGGLYFNNAFDSSYSFNSSGRVFSFGTGPFSIACGFMFDSISGQRGIITQIDNSATAGDFYIYFFNGDGKIRCGRRSTTSALSCQALTNTLSAGTNYGVVMTSPGVNDVSVYQDGNFVQRVTSTGSYSTTSTTKTILGGLEDISGRCMDGPIYYVFAWSRIITSQEIALISRGASPLSMRRPVGGLPFTRGGVFPHYVGRRMAGGISVGIN